MSKSATSLFEDAETEVDAEERLANAVGDVDDSAPVTDFEKNPEAYTSDVDEGSLFAE